MTGKKTHFASAIRSTSEELYRESELVGSQKYFHDISGTLTGIVAVIECSS